MASSSQIQEARAFVDQFNKDYEARHWSFEQQFWGTKMALKSTAEVTYSAENLSQTKARMEDFLSDPVNRSQAEEYRQKLPKDSPGDLIKTLDIIIKTCRCYDMSSAPEAKHLREEIAKLESELEHARNRMTLGFQQPDGAFCETSSVGLRNVMKTNTDEAVRKSAYAGLKSIGPFCLENGFVEIIKLRIKMAKLLGYSDFYEYKVQNAEGFGKDALFEILDTLEQGTRPILTKARKELENRFGKAALEPWNTAFMTSGSVQSKMDPYFPFAKAVERYVASYAAMGISYEDSTMTLDLLERPMKHDNGFCHWPRVAWIKPDGSWQPATTNFTSCADPKAVGSGLAALTVLMHEAGHAAHFANIKQPSPLFSQERAPTSVPYAENQSMFLDSLVGDSAWRAIYARNEKGEPIPFDILEEDIRAAHPFAVFQLRGMLSVSYFEKALYELPEHEVTAAKVCELADKIELEIQGGYALRPILAYPHIISDEASCYYHGYTLAEMSVHQTRHYFKDKYGSIVDNNRIGPDLTKAYWEYGNSKPFLNIVKDLTGKELSGKAWVDVLNESVDDKVVREKKEYQDALAKMASKTTKDSAAAMDRLKMTIKFMDGDILIADSSQNPGGILGACKVFEQFVATR